MLTTVIQVTGYSCCRFLSGSTNGHVDITSLYVRNIVCILYWLYINSKVYFFFSPTDAQVNCLKNNFKIYIKIDIKTAPTCFGATTIIRERIIRSGGVATATPPD